MATDMEFLKQLHRLIVQNEREIRALKARLAQVSVGATILSSAVNPHGLLSLTHIDTVPGGAVEGMIIRANASNLWERRQQFDDTGLIDPGVAEFAARNDHAHPVEGLVRSFINDSGGNLELGDVVVLKTTGDDFIDVTASLGDADVLGVVAESGPFADGISTPILLAGYHAFVKVTGTVARGDYLQTSASVGVAEAVTEPDIGAFARVVADDSGGFAACVVFDRTLSVSSGGATVVFDATNLTDGVEDTFTTPSDFIAGRTRVHLNGLLQRLGADYTESGSTDIVMADPPNADDELIIVYGSEGNTPFRFIDLNDVPSAYAGAAGKAATVKDDETGLEFVEASGGFPNLRPASPNAMDDEFDDSSGSSGPINGVDAKWTLRGANAPTITYPARSWSKFVANTTTFGYDQAKPAAQDYEVTMRYAIGGVVGDVNSFGGLYLRDNTNGDMYTFHMVCGNNNTRVFDLEVSKWGNSGTFLGGAFTGLKSLTNAELPSAIRITYTNSSTAIAFEASYDGGLSWINIWTESTDAIAHTHVGFFKTYDAGSANQRTLVVDWFRRTV